MEYRRADREPQRMSTRTVTVNISPGGVYFETLAKPDIRPGVLLHLELIIPPGEGHFPYQGRVTTVAQVVRTTVLPADEEADDQVDGKADYGYRRLGIAATFKDSLKLSF